MIHASLSALAHRVYRRPVCDCWLAFSDGFDVRVYTPTPHWRFAALQITQELVEAFVLTHQHVTPDQINTFDFNHCDSERLLNSAPYANAHIAGTVFETMLALRLGVNISTHSRAIEGLHEPVYSPHAVKQAF